MSQAFRHRGNRHQRNSLRERWTPALWGLLATMVVIVVSANILVQYPVQSGPFKDWLTWGAITYPISYLITDWSNRWYGSWAARRVVWAGFAVAVVLSMWLATPRIALASGSAFLVSQFMDVALFDRLRDRAWWQPPLLSSILGSLVDTVLFFSLAFAGTQVPWVTLALGDYTVKVVIALALLAPYRAGLLLRSARQ